MPIIKSKIINNENKMTCYALKHIQHFDLITVHNQ